MLVLLLLLLLLHSWGGGIQELQIVSYELNDGENEEDVNSLRHVNGWRIIIRPSLIAMQNDYLLILTFLNEIEGFRRECNLMKNVFKKMSAMGGFIVS